MVLLKRWWSQQSADFQRNASKLLVQFWEIYLRLKQQSNQQCNELLDCDIVNFHTSLLLSVDMDSPKIEKGRGLQLVFLKLLTMQESSKNTASALATFLLLANTELLYHFNAHQQLAKGCKLQVWRVFFLFCLFLQFGVFCLFWFFNRTIQKKASTAMLALQLRPPTSETGNGSPTNSLIEKSKLKYFREYIPNQWYQSTQSSLHRLSISNKQDNTTLGKTTSVSILTFTCFLTILHTQSSSHTASERATWQPSLHLVFKTFLTIHQVLDTGVGTGVCEFLQRRRND